MLLFIVPDKVGVDPNQLRVNFGGGVMIGGVIISGVIINFKMYPLLSSEAPPLRSRLCLRGRSTVVRVIRVRFR